MFCWTVKINNEGAKLVLYQSLGGHLDIVLVQQNQESQVFSLFGSSADDEQFQERRINECNDNPTHAINTSDGMRCDSIKPDVFGSVDPCIPAPGRSVIPAHNDQ